MKNDPYEAFKAELLKNIRQTITRQRANGVLAMSKENLMQVTPTPKESIGAGETNARWIYREMFEDTLACLPRAYRVFVERNESILGAGVRGKPSSSLFSMVRDDEFSIWIPEKKGSEWEQEGDGAMPCVYGNWRRRDRVKARLHVRWHRAGRHACDLRSMTKA